MFSSYFVLQSFTDVNSCRTVLRNNVIQPMKKFVPDRITRTPQTNAWMNTETRRMVRRKNRAFRKAQFTMGPRDLQRYKYLRPKCQRIIRQAYNTCIQNIVCHDTRKNLIEYCLFVKSIKQDASGVALLYIDYDDPCSDPLTKSNISRKHFQSVFSNEGISTFPRLNMSSYPTVSHITIHASGVENLVRNLNSHKATGPDAIPAVHLCELSTDVAHALKFVFKCHWTLVRIQMTGEWPT